MRLKSIHIKGLFGNRTFDWDLGDVNILGGKNGVGKSTILKCCYYLIKDGKIPQNQRLHELVNHVRLQFTNGWHLVWDYAVVGETSNLANIFDENENMVSFEDFSRELRPYFINSFEQYIYKAAEIASKFAAIGNETDVTYLDTLIEDQRNIRNARFAGTMEKLLNSLQDPQQDFRKIQEVIDQDDFKAYMLLYPVINTFFKDYRISVNNDFSFERGDSTIPYTNLSMGEKQLLYVLLVASNTIFSQSILFMDEPDLGMHIDWKETLIKQIKSVAPATQIIMSTHAPSVIKGWQNCVKEFSQLSKTEGQWKQPYLPHSTTNTVS